jgi:DNA-binding transcriptional MerR regulator
MTARRSYQVKDVAVMTGVSVRTLHHYDEIKLLVPKNRTRAGYRLYSDNDLLRLQQILIGRELGLSLEEIRRSLDDPCFDRTQSLLKQREQLRQRAQQTESMIRAIDTALAALETTKRQERDRKTTMKIDMKAIFDGFDPEKYAAEARQRWAGTDAYKESAKRTNTYTKEDWLKIQTEQANIYKDAFAAMTAGRKPFDAHVMDIAERHRLSIDRWFYPCSRAQHTGLASLYESDERFAANINKYGEGLAAFLVAAIRANCGRQ